MLPCSFCGGLVNCCGAAVFGVEGQGVYILVSATATAAATAAAAAAAMDGVLSSSVQSANINACDSHSLCNLVNVPFYWC